MLGSARLWFAMNCTVNC